MDFKFPVTSHTDYVTNGTNFVVQEGKRQSGNDYVRQAVQKGAIKIIFGHTNIDADLLMFLKNSNIATEFVKDTRFELSKLSATAFDYPASKLNIIGVTGTKGKTSSVFLIYHLLKKLNIKAAIMSGVYCEVGELKIKSSLTTPQPDFIHWFLNEALIRGATHVVMETSAQAFSLSRLAHVDFNIGLFTNFSSEHLEFYKDLDEYLSAKLILAQHIKKSGYFIINQDDQSYQNIIDKLPMLDLNNFNAQTFSSKYQDANFYYQINNCFPVAISCQDLIINSFLVGKFNAVNLAGVVAVMCALGFKLDQLNDLLSDFAGVPGRMEKYALNNGAVAIVDYAHNPSSFESFFSTVRELTANLIVVFGCGGERDPARRPVMGNIAATYADTIILTTDNCRSEKPLDIISDIKEGVPKDLLYKVIVEVDRADAIKLACQLSKKDSLIAILGKGPDEYQEINGVKFVFSDVKEVLKFVYN
jgi:UDP-N-acetylmuramoyl-L-alanyl-D-glutamate--2,6-diaminopimelate ligase